jgi:hypothetical protein
VIVWHCWANKACFAILIPVVSDAMCRLVCLAPCNMQLLPTCMTKHLVTSGDAGCCSRRLLLHMMWQCRLYHIHIL